eukprot:scaffold6911_cov394-Prasinococcus_capsulatus_cf.AAC.1
MRLVPERSVCDIYHVSLIRARDSYSRHAVLLVRPCFGRTPASRCSMRQVHQVVQLQSIPSLWPNAGSCGCCGDLESTFNRQGQAVTRQDRQHTRDRKAVQGRTYDSSSTIVKQRSMD